jgi:hypothetical protein
MAITSSLALPTRICLRASWNQRFVILFFEYYGERLGLMDILCGQIATMQWVREQTSIPVPRILAYELDQSHALGAHMLLEKVGSSFDLASPLLFSVSQ